MGTTDLHGSVFNWDYFTDASFDDAAHNDVGLAKISTLVDRIREEKGRRNTLLIDAGDTIQGTQLSYYYAKVDPVTGANGPVHPMAQAMNAIGYDAAALGNHAFNYGIPVLRKFEEQCDFPLLGANALDAKTLRPHGRPVLRGGRQRHGHRGAVRPQPRRAGGPCRRPGVRLGGRGAERAAEAGRMARVPRPPRRASAPGRGAGRRGGVVMSAYGRTGRAGREGSCCR